MSERQWTLPQKKAITARGGDLLISAAAGSGKTAVLTERVLSLITDRENPVDIDRLLIVTFSNAAAEEMRQRIAQRLYEKMEQEPENAALRRQSLLLGNAEICTIHAFCYRLIRENFQVLGLPGDMQLGREGENDLLQAAVLEELLDEEYEKAEPEFMRLIELFSWSRNDLKVMNLLLILYQFLRNHPFYRAWAEAYIAADTETGLDETVWSGLLRQRAWVSRRVSRSASSRRCTSRPTPPAERPPRCSRTPWAGCSCMWAICSACWCRFPCRAR